jgi:hypothetical protein
MPQTRYSYQSWPSDTCDSTVPPFDLMADRKQRPQALYFRAGARLLHTLIQSSAKPGCFGPKLRCDFCGYARNVAPRSPHERAPLPVPFGQVGSSASLSARLTRRGGAATTPHCTWAGIAFGRNTNTPSSLQAPRPAASCSFRRFTFMRPPGLPSLSIK